MGSGTLLHGGITLPGRASRLTPQGHPTAYAPSHAGRGVARKQGAATSSSCNEMITGVERRATCTALLARASPGPISFELNEGLSRPGPAWANQGRALAPTGADLHQSESSVYPATPCGQTVARSFQCSVRVVCDAESRLDCRHCSTWGGARARRVRATGAYNLHHARQEMRMSSLSLGQIHAFHSGSNVDTPVSLTRAHTCHTHAAGQ